MPQSLRRPVKARNACSPAQMARAISAAAIFALLLAGGLREVPASAAPASPILAAR